jgi:hypothetical protein
MRLIARSTFGILLVIVIMAALFAQYIHMKGNRTEKEMFDEAHEALQDWIWELAIDSTLFMPTIVKVNGDSLRSYEWIGLSPNGDTVGIEVLVPGHRSAKPEVHMIGPDDAWTELVGTRWKKNKEPADLWRQILAFVLAAAMAVVWIIGIRKALRWLARP